MEAVPFETLVKSYLEIGVLGLLVVIFIMIIVVVARKLINDWSNKDKKIDSKDKKIENLYDKMFQMQKELFDNMADKIIREVTQHTPSVEENKKLTEVQYKIDNILEQMMVDTKASRVVVVQYHNGGRGMNKQSFLKMSATNERMKVGEQPFVPSFQNQFRSVLSYIVGELEKNKYFDIEDIETLKDVDYGSYDYLKTFNIKQAYYRALIGEENMVIGFVVVIYTNNTDRNGNKKKIDEIMKTKCGALETLLTLDIEK